MCRYAMTAYKPHYACFHCRKTFKRRLLGDVIEGWSKEENETPAKCPECSNLMADMGMDFESPKKNNVKAWEHISLLYTVGVTFHSCGCSGPGYIPSNADDLIQHFVKIKKTYLKHQQFWARRISDPTTQSEIAKDKHQNGKFLYATPKSLKKGTKNTPIYDASEAQKYWNDKVLVIENKIRKVTDTKALKSK